MTNNLKAERTLTAEDYVSGERLSELIAILEAKWGWTQDEQDTFRTLKELQHLRSQSLSPQQPMGEVREYLSQMNVRKGAEAIYRDGPCIGGETEDGWEAQSEGYKQKAMAVAHVVLSALHPNQEGGE